MPREKPYGGAPRLDKGDTPAGPSSPGGTVSSFGGAPTILPINVNRGNKTLGQPGTDVYPAQYGGAPSLGKQSKSKLPSASGNGQNRPDSTIP